MRFIPSRPRQLLPGGQGQRNKARIGWPIRRDTVTSCRGKFVLLCKVQPFMLYFMYFKLCYKIEQISWKKFEKNVLKTPVGPY